MSGHAGTPGHAGMPADAEDKLLIPGELEGMITP